MIEKTVIDWLNLQLDGIPAYSQEPESTMVPGDGVFVVVEKTGSSMKNHIWTGIFAIQSYAPTLYEAAGLNERVKAAMFNIVNLDVITRAELNSDYNFTNTSKKQFRYQAVFELTHYELKGE